MTMDSFRDYCSAEVTLFWTGSGDQGDNRIIFAVTELIPENQLPSPPFGSEKTACLSHRLSKRAKVYCKRFFCTVAEAVKCYEKADWSLLDSSLSLHIGEHLKLEPQSGYALVIPRCHVVIGHWASNLSMVLPNRETSIRACAYVEKDDALRNSFTKGERSNIATFVRRYCGVDLEAYDEFLGASIQQIYDEKRAEQISLYILSGGNYDKGFVHDRFLILDETVYCLGSSLNGFGTKDTVLFRSPNPDAFIRRTKEWEKEKYLLKEWGRKTDANT